MLKTIEIFYNRGLESIKLGIPISKIMDKDIVEELYKIKYTVPNNDFSLLDNLENQINKYFDEIEAKYRE